MKMQMIKQDLTPEEKDALKDTWNAEEFATANDTQEPDLKWRVDITIDGKKLTEATCNLMKMETTLTDTKGTKIIKHSNFDYVGIGE